MNQPALMPNEGAPASVIRRRLERLVMAIRSKDLDAVMSIYAPDIVSFDLLPPLQYAGLDAKRRAWQEMFAAHVAPIEYDVPDPIVTVSGDLAFVRSVNHVRAARIDDRVTDLRVRWTACLQRFDGLWLIVHDHVSIPADAKIAEGAG